MAIRIQTEKPVIPIEIGPHNFEFDLSDEAVKRFKRDYLEIRKELEAIEMDEDDEAVIDQAKDILARGFELMLGAGAFEKVYELSPSVIICMKYLEQIGEGIATELQKRGYAETQMDKAQKYIQAKKKK